MNLILSFLVFTYIFSYSVSEETDFSIENERVLQILRNRAKTKVSAEQEKISLTVGEYNRTLDEIKDLKSKLEKIELMNKFDEKIHQIIWSVKRRNEYVAKKHWEEIYMDLQNQTNNSTESYYLKDMIRTIALSTYEGIRTNLIPIINFIDHTQIYSGYFHLLQEMKDYGHVYYGSEIFYLANLIRQNCGNDSKLYGELPLGVQFIDSHPVYLQSEKNEGILIYKPAPINCHGMGRACTRAELFTYHDQIKTDDEQSRVHFQFIKIPETFTSLVHDPKFYIKVATTNSSSTNSSDKYLHYGLEFKFISDEPKSRFIVHLVNNTEDLLRIRFEQSHLVKRLIMAKPYFGSSYTGVEVLGLEDRFDRANDGNWIVISGNEEKITRKRRHQLIKLDKSSHSRNLFCEI